MNYRKKKIWLNQKHTKYCWVFLFDTKKDLQAHYDNYTFGRDKNLHPQVKIAGASLHWVRSRGRKVHPETGRVILSRENCGAGLISHEFMHAILWAFKHHYSKKNWPVIIKNRKEEEELLMNLTYSVKQFYKWYWKVIDPLLKEKL